MILTIIFPVLNERLRLERGITRTGRRMKRRKLPVPYVKSTIVSNMSVSAPAGWGQLSEKV